MKATIGGKHPHLLYCLAPAMRPRMLLTLDEQEQLLPIPVRVGQAVDTVAQVSMSSLCHARKSLPPPLSLMSSADLRINQQIPCLKLKKAAIPISSSPSQDTMPATGFHGNAFIQGPALSELL